MAWKSVLSGRLNTGQTLEPKNLLSVTKLCQSQDFYHRFPSKNKSEMFQGFSENLNSHDTTCWVITSDSQRDESQTFFCLSVRFEPYYSAGPQRYTYKVSIQQQQQQYSESVFIRSSRAKCLKQQFQQTSLTAKFFTTRLQASIKILTLVNCTVSVSFTVFTACLIK